MAWLSVGMLLTIVIIFLGIIKGHNLFLHAWAITGMIMFWWVGRIMRSKGFDSFLATEDIGKAVGVLFLCYMVVPSFPTMLFFEHRMDMTWYSRIAKRGYIFPTESNKREHFLKRLNGELTE